LQRSYPKPYRGHVWILDQAIQRPEGTNTIRPAVFLSRPKCLGRDGLYSRHLRPSARDRQHVLDIVPLLLTVDQTGNASSHHCSYCLWHRSDFALWQGASKVPSSRERAGQCAACARPEASKHRGRSTRVEAPGMPVTYEVVLSKNDHV